MSSLSFGDPCLTWNVDVLDLAIAHEAQIKFDYPQHGYGAAATRIVSPSEWNDNGDGFIATTDDGAIRNFLLEKIPGYILVKPGA